MQLFSKLCLLAVLLASTLMAQSEDPLPFDTTQYRLLEVGYKSTAEAELKLHLYYPPVESNQLLSAILFFFGGGWVGGSHQHFAPHSKYLASRGILAITADYRVKNRHNTSPIEAIKDARDALKYLTNHAAELNIDTSRLAVGGGSAGGHLALCTALIDQFDEEKALPYSPKALVLYNPVANTTSEGFGSQALGKDSINASPYHHINPDMPPTLIFHGEADTTVPIENINDFKNRMDSLGVKNQVLTYPDQKHGFFNIGRQPQHRFFLETLYRTDEFLIQQSFLTGEPSFQLPNSIH